MSTVLVVTPLIVASWPLMSAAITAAVGTLGFAAPAALGTLGFAAAQNRDVARVRQLAGSTVSAEIELEDSEILAGSAGTGERMVVERDGIRAIFSRDARGALKLCVEGHGHSKAQLKEIGEALVGRVTQQYAYHRLVSELKERRLTIVEERVGQDQAIHIRVRSS
jgi:Protein of unknown function (DUF1257)